MRKLVIGALALFLTSGTATATDHYGSGSGQWTGAQLGVLYGYSWMKDMNNVLRLTAEGDGDVMGVYAAYNHQMGHFVGGGEISYSRHNNMFTDGSGVRVGDVFAAKLRAGVGYDRYNAYAMAGVTHGTTNLAGDDWGAVFGVGLDVLLTHYLVAGIQYNYYNYVDFNHTKIDADLSELTVRLGYKF